MYEIIDLQDSNFLEFVPGTIDIRQYLEILEERKPHALLAAKRLSDPELGDLRDVCHVIFGRRIDDLTGARNE